MASAPTPTAFTAVPVSTQRHGQRPDEGGVVLDQQQLGHRPATGSVTVIVSPPPGVVDGDDSRAHGLGETVDDGQAEPDVRARPSVVELARNA